MDESKVMTIVVRIENKDEWQPFWDAFTDGTQILGMKPFAVSWGNVLKERDELQKELDQYKDDADGCDAYEEYEVGRD